MLCKRDDVENKINNKFCMQQHYETIANPTTCLALLLPAPPLPPLCFRCVCVWADKLQLVFSLRAQHGECVIRHKAARLPDVQLARSLVAFLWPLLTYAP